MTNESTKAQIEGLATLLVLDDEIKRLMNKREFGFFSTNETHRLIAFHTGFLWEKKEFIGPEVIAQSGTAELDIHSSTNQWLKEKISAIEKTKHAKDLHQFSISDFAEGFWPETLPHFLLWCPFLRNDAITGGLVFFRDDPFSEAEIKMLRWLIASYQYAWNVLIKPQSLAQWHLWKKKPYFITLMMIITAILFFPIRLSVLGHGTVVPQSPILINAPMQGIIKNFSVNPGDKVKKDQLLVTMDQTDLLASLEVSKRDASLTKAKLRTAINEAFSDKNKRTEVPILEAQASIDQERLKYTEELLAKTQIKSPIAGIVIFDSKEDWIGQPVQTGERILVVANPVNVKLRISLPMSESIYLKIGNDGKFFIQGQLTAIPVTLSQLGYNAKLMPNKILAYQLEATFTDETHYPQIGAQGTVKLYGQRVPLIYYFLRRPIQALRQNLGI